MRKKIAKWNFLRKFRVSNSLRDLELYQRAEREFKAYVLSRKLRYQATKRDELVSTRRNPKDFWNVLRSSVKRAVVNNNIPCDTWFKYF